MSNCELTERNLTWRGTLTDQKPTTQPTKVSKEIPLTESERLSRFSYLDLLAERLNRAGIEGLGLAYGSTFYANIGQSSRDLDAKLAINPEQITPTIKLLRKLGYEGAQLTDRRALLRFRRGDTDSFRLRGEIPGTQTPVDLEVVNGFSLSKFISKDECIFRMGIMSHELFEKLRGDIHPGAPVMGTDLNLYNFPLPRWQLPQKNCVWLFDLKPAKVEVSDQGRTIPCITSIHDTLMVSVPFYVKGGLGKRLENLVESDLWVKVAESFLELQNLKGAVGRVIPPQLARTFTFMFTRKRRFSPDFNDWVMTRAVRAFQKIADRENLGFTHILNGDFVSDEIGKTPDKAGTQANLYRIHKSERDANHAIKTFPKNGGYTLENAKTLMAAYLVYRWKVEKYIKVPKIADIDIFESKGKWKVSTIEEMVGGGLDLEEMIANGSLTVAEIEKIFRETVSVQHRIWSDSDELYPEDRNRLSTMVELKPANLVYSPNSSELTYIDLFPPRMYEPGKYLIWPYFGKISPHKRPERAKVFGDVRNILRYMLFSFTCLRDDLDPEIFFNIIGEEFIWNPDFNYSFPEFIKKFGTTKISARQKELAHRRGKDFKYFFGI